MGKILIIKGADFSSVAIEKVVPSTTKVDISVVASPEGGGSVTGGGNYYVGTSVTLTATANTGYEFVQWADGDTNATRTIIVSESATYTAVFSDTGGMVNVLGKLTAFTTNVNFPTQDTNKVTINHTAATWAASATASALGLVSTSGTQYRIKGTLNADYSGKISVGTFITTGERQDMSYIEFTSGTEQTFDVIVTKTSTTASTDAILYIGRAGENTEGNITFTSLKMSVVS